jgi:hypothetical protein
VAQGGLDVIRSHVEVLARAPFGRRINSSSSYSAQNPTNLIGSDLP